MTPGVPDSTHAGPPPECQTCGDIALPMRVLSVDRVEALATCLDRADVRRSVDIGLLATVDPGDTLLVHAGTALFREPR